ncbi:MAG: putative DNA binding domain-containing protein [Tannerella sp.]|jgi:ATP-dependent DNA helicase RecG|nr:putative DNA binding domain-containing protein [Tannerella sp.]
MPESQNIEYKSSWRDEYLRWICGFANANGGSIYIGKDNSGAVVGVKDSNKLMEDLPNKITTILGIVCDVNLYTTEQGEFIEIVVEPQPNAVSYKGEYHYRSGSTKQELKGAALDKFLLKKQGKHWDSVPVLNVTVADLKSETFDFFRKRGVKSKRLDQDTLTDSNELLLENLQLTENNFLKRAAVLLFHPNPEKFVTGAFIKIGYFESDSDLIFQDEIHGNLFEQVEKTMELLFSKYIKAIIGYEGKFRVENYEYPYDAIREAIHNAVAHKDYTGGIPIQISVYKDKIMIWNFGQLPENWTLNDLLHKHSSRPHNPDISTAFFRIGYIEAWGRGMYKMKKQCIEANLPAPTLSANGQDFWIVFNKELDLTALNLNNRQLDAIKFFKGKGEIVSSEYATRYYITVRTATTDIAELVEKGLLVKEGTLKTTKYYFR